MNELMDCDRIPSLIDGLEVTSDGYDVWECYRDGGIWWARERDGEGLVELCRCERKSARMLESRYFTRA